MLSRRTRNGDSLNSLSVFFRPVAFRRARNLSTRAILKVTCGNKVARGGGTHPNIPSRVSGSKGDPKESTTLLEVSRAFSVRVALTQMVGADNKIVALDSRRYKSDLSSRKYMFVATFRKPLALRRLIKRRKEEREEGDGGADRDKEDRFVPYSINANNLPLPEDECKKLEYWCL